MKTDANSYKVYQITFDDGFAYVGITRFSIEDRIRRHKSRPINAELQWRLQRFSYKYGVLLDNLTLQEAYRAESRFIKTLEKPINIFGVAPDKKVHFNRAITAISAKTSVGRKRRRHVDPPREGYYYCSACRQLLPHTAYNIEVQRFNGLHSRCKPCQYLLNSPLAKREYGFTKADIQADVKGTHAIYYKLRDKLKTIRHINKKILEHPLSPPLPKVKPIRHNGTGKALGVIVTTCLPLSSGERYLVKEYCFPKRNKYVSFFNRTRFLNSIEYNIFELIREYGSLPYTQVLKNKIPLSHSPMLKRYTAMQKKGFISFNMRPSKRTYFQYHYPEYTFLDEDGNTVIYKNGEITYDK